MTNLTPTSDVYADPVPTPDPAEPVRSGGIIGLVLGAIRPSLQALLNRSWSIVNGKVLLRGLAVGLNPGAAANPASGTMTAFGAISSTTGDVSAGQDLVAARDVQAGGVVNGASHRTTDANGTMIATGPRVAFTSVGNGADGGNPPPVTPIPNQLRPVNTPKAWGVFRTTDVPVFAEGIGFLSGGIQGGDPQKIDIALSTNMASEIYGVEILTRRVDNGNFVGWANLVRAVNKITIGYNVDLTAANYEITVFVFGRQS